MVGPPPRTAILRYILPNGLASLEFYPLPLGGEVKLGRGLSCQIILDSEIHTGVSRHHARIVVTDLQSGCWMIEDLNSSNGTYVNGHRLDTGQVLCDGDYISLGQRGPRFVFEFISLGPTGIDTAPVDEILDSTLPPISTHSSGESRTQSRGISGAGWRTALPPESSSKRSPSVTFSQLFPIVSTGQDLTRKAHLIPSMVTVAFVVLMFLTMGQQVQFNMVLAAQISSAGYFFVYQICGKRKPWWVLIGAGLTTALLMVTPVLQVFIWFFRGVLPGDIPDLSNIESVNLWVLLGQMFLGAGLMEELLKAVPILIGVWVGSLLRGKTREALGVCEPLDGILLGAASAVGFTLVETLGQYVPNVISNGVALQASETDVSELALQLMFPRILGSVSGHMAYSGYLGYFIGLSVLYPRHRWRIFGTGYLTASLLHALWNTTGYISPILLALVGMLSYAFLAASILKARAISPTRDKNFSTELNHRQRYHL